MEVGSFPLQSMRITSDMEMHANPEQVFAALTTGVSMWWDAKHLEGQKLARDLILEPKLGGRFYETWQQPATDKDGALLGNVIQIHRWQLVKIAGYFGLEEHCALGVVSIRLSRIDSGTHMKFSHDAVGDITDETKKTMAAFWDELFQSLKKQLEEHESHGLRVDPFED